MHNLTFLVYTINNLPIWTDIFNNIRQNILRIQVAYHTLLNSIETADNGLIKCNCYTILQLDNILYLTTTFSWIPEMFNVRMERVNIKFTCAFVLLKHYHFSHGMHTYKFWRNTQLRDRCMRIQEIHSYMFLCTS